MTRVTNPTATVFSAALLATTLAATALAEQVEPPPHPATQAQTDQQVIVDRAELPAGFPPDVPLYPAMQSPTVARAGDSFTVRGQTPDSGVKVANYLTAAMADRGWTLLVDDKNPAKHRMMFTRGARQVDVMITLENQVTLLRMQVPAQAEGT